MVEAATLLAGTSTLDTMAAGTMATHMDVDSGAMMVTTEMTGTVGPRRAAEAGGTVVTTGSSVAMEAAGSLLLPAASLKGRRDPITGSGAAIGHFGEAGVAVVVLLGETHLHLGSIHHPRRMMLLGKTPRRQEPKVRLRCRPTLRFRVRRVGNMP